MRAINCDAMDESRQSNPIKIVNGALGVVPALISEQSDMEIVGVARTPIELLLEVKRTDADVVVLEIKDDTTPGLFSHLFAEFPRLVVLGIERHDARAFVEQLCPRRREIGAFSDATRMIDALRKAVLSPCDDH